MTASRSRERERLRMCPRDQAISQFTEILLNLVETVAGARAAALVDFEGETVDYAGVLDPFELKVCAAHWQIVVSEIGATRIGTPHQIIVRARRWSYLVRQLRSGYAIVVVLHASAAFAASERALHEADFRLCAEAGWTAARPAIRWYRVEVEPDRADHRRPARLRGVGGWHQVEVMGCIVGLHPRERGFRVRLPNGAELSLVRERIGRWFADDHVDR